LMNDDVAMLYQPLKDRMRAVFAAISGKLQIA